MELVQEKLAAGGLGVEIGTLTTCSSSAHLYWKRDEDDLETFKEHLFKKYHMFIEEE